MVTKPIVFIRHLPKWIPVLFLVFSDLCAAFAANRLAVHCRYYFSSDPTPLKDYFDLWPSIILFVGIFALQRLYAISGINPADEIRRVFRSSILVYLIAVGALFAVKAEMNISRLTLVIGAVGTILLVLLFRYILRYCLCRFEWWGEPVLVLGAGTTGQKVVRSLRRAPYLGWRPVAILDDDVSKHGQEISDIPIIGSLDDAPELAQKMHLRTAIIAMPGASIERLRQLEQACAKVFPHLIILPNFCGYASMWVESLDFGGILGLEIRRNLLMFWPRFAKRCFDLSFCVIGMIFIIPITVVFAIMIRCTSKGSVFYGQQRIGRDGRSFKAWKFRSMVSNADTVLKEYLEKHPELREEWEKDHKLRDDPRVTAVGRILRKTSLDELPQIWNVLKGDMSLIGPRPIVQAEIPKYRDLFDLYVQVRPGISGLWQVSGRNDTTYDERVMLDAAYVRNWSVWLDAWILIRTVRVVLLGKGAY